MNEPRRQFGPSDGDLLESIRAGRVDALETLMSRHWDGLLMYAIRFVGTPDDAEDIAQEVFVRVWEHRSRWVRRGSARSYLYRIARNLALLNHRHQDVRARAESEIRSRAPRVVTPAEHVTHNELRDAFERAFEALPNQRREVFLLVRLRGLSLEEAGEVLGITRRTVANHLYLAAKDLEKALRPFLR